jgi:hypothetical protein
MSRVKALSEVVAPSILTRAKQISTLLRELGVPHALIGGLAVGVHGHPRATKDVDFLVGQEAFETTEPFLVYREELTELARIGETDIMYIPDRFPGLAGELRLEDDIPIISLPGLVLMKLSAFRVQDQEDVRSLLRVHSCRIREVRDYLQENAPELIIRLAEVLAPR